MLNYKEIAPILYKKIYATEETSSLHHVQY